MKPWTEASNNKYMKYHSKLTYQLSFWNVSQKLDYHAGGKWFIQWHKCNLWIINCNMDMIIPMEKFPNAWVSDGLSQTVVIPGEFTHITGFNDFFDVSLNN